MSANVHSRDSDHTLFAELCPCRSLLDLLGNKWSSLTIGVLDDGPHRFGELQRKLEGISPKVLAQTLRRLESSGLVGRTVYAEVPLHVEYFLTDLGHSASVPLAHLRTWALENMARVPNLMAAASAS